jgi:hypothetical protein
MANQQAVAADAFIQSIGINTHLDFYGGPYGNLGTVESALSYLGVSNVRDSAFYSNDISAWQQVAQATGVKFDAFIGEVGPGNYGTELSTMQQLAGQGLLNAIEGANEPDAAYSSSLGESTWDAASYQQQVWQLGQQLGLPVINTSFGNINDYGSTGDLSAWTNYGNAHTYFGSGNNPGWANWIGTLTADAQSSAGSRPVMTTETGYYTTGNGGDPHTVSEIVQAKYTLDLLMDGWQAGDARSYLYELLDQGTGDGNPEDNFGLFHSDGSAKPAATAVHNLTSLLNDPGGSGMSGGSLDYALSGLQGTDNSMLMQKSDGTFWLAVWNDTRLSGPNSPTDIYVPPHSVTLTLGSAASNIQVFDPLTGTNAVQSASGTGSITFDVPDHPVLVEIGGSGTAPGGNSAGNGTPSPTPTPAPIPAPVTQPSSNGMALSAPTSVQDGQNVPVGGVNITDDYALSHPDTVTATIGDQNGSLWTMDAWGNAQQGSSLTLSGTIWQVNAGLANIQYTGSGGDNIAIQTSDSVGNQASQTVTVGSGAAQSSAPTPTPPQDGQQIADNDSTPVITGSNIAATASGGDHMIFIAGTGDTLTATGGTETVQSYQGGNSITTGAGDDTIRFAGSGNTIDAGAGNNHLEDSGNNNTIVLPGANQGSDDLYGWVTQNGDTFDLRPLLAQTGWNGDPNSIGNFVQVNMSADNAVISVDPNGSGAGGSTVAMLHASGAMNLSSLLAHSIT